jgi:putative heme-binding domain-containing protein
MPLLFALTAALLVLALVLWWGASVHLAIPVVWIASAAVPAALADGPRLWVDRGTNWTWSIVVAYALAAVFVAVGVWRVERRFRRKRVLIPEINEYLRTVTLPEPIRTDREPNAMDAELLRWCYSFAFQPDDDLIGLDWGEQFHSGTQVRYQLNGLAWSMSLYAANFVPNAPSVITDALERVAIKHTDLRVWKYWRALNLFGNFDANPDPICRDNIMFSAFFCDALNTLAGRAGNARQLLAAVASGAVPRTDLTADLVRQLRNHKDEALRKQLTELWGVMKETSPDMQAEVERVKRVYWAGGSTPGDGPRGRVVFNKICAQCHTLFDSGGHVGPDITGANRSDLDYLLQNILYPNAVVPNEYRATTIETKDDRTITGIVKEQNATAVVIQTANELLTVPRGEIKSQSTSDQSLMPEGLIAQLKDGEMRDLLYYLSRPGQVNLPATK